MATLIPESLTDLNRLRMILSPQAAFPSQELTTFTQLVNGASQFVLTLCKRKSFKYSTISSEIHDGEYSNLLLTDYFPVVSITTLYDDPTRKYESGTLLDADTYEIQDSDAGIIRRLDGKFSNGMSNVSVSYVSGYSEFEIITSYNDTIVVNEGASDISVVISAGKYNSSTLAAELQTQLNANVSTANTYTATYSESMRRFTIGVAAGTLTLKWTSNVELGQLLGFDTEADDSGKTSYVSNYGELGIPEDLIEATNSLVRWRYEEIRERRIGRFSVSGDRESSSFDFSNIPSYITQMIAPYQLRRI